MYQKTNAVSEIKRVGKDSFWAKAEVSAAQGTRGELPWWSVCGGRARCETLDWLHLCLSSSELAGQMSLLAPCTDGQLGLQTLGDRAGVALERRLSHGHAGPPGQDEGKRAGVRGRQCRG